MESTQFRHLPLEIRACVWRMSLHQRVIAVAHHHVSKLPNTPRAGNPSDGDAGNDDASDNVVATTRFLPIRPPPLPPTVRVNREARGETLPLYPWVSVDMDDGNGPIPSEPFRFNGAIDQLLLTSRCGGHHGRPTLYSQYDEEAEGRAAFLLLRAVCGIVNRLPGRIWSCDLRHLAVETHLFLLLRRTGFYHASPEATSAMEDFLQTVRTSPTLETCTFYPKLDPPSLRRAAGYHFSMPWCRAKSFRLARKPPAREGSAVASETPYQTLQRAGAVLANPLTVPRGNLTLFSVLDSSDLVSQASELQDSMAGLSSADLGALRGGSIHSDQYRDEALGYCLGSLIQQMGENSDEPVHFAHGICMPNYGFTHDGEG